MSNCRVRRGFFVLRDCGEPTAQICRGCQRTTCAKHYDGAVNLCIECKSRDKDLTWRDDGYAMSRRNSYYRDRGYSPIYWGHFHHDPYYNDYNVRDFDSAGDNDGFDGDEVGDFHDS